MQIARGAILLSFFHYSVCVKSAPIGLKSEPTQQQCLFITFFSAPFPTFLLLPRKNTSERSYFAKLFSKNLFSITELFFQTVLSSIWLLRRLGELQRRNLLISRYTFLGLQSLLKSPLLQKRQFYLYRNHTVWIHKPESIYRTQLLNYKTVNYKKRAVLYVMIFCTYIFASLASRKE